MFTVKVFRTYNFLSVFYTADFSSLCEAEKFAASINGNPDLFARVYVA